MFMDMLGHLLRPYCRGLGELDSQIEKFRKMRDTSISDAKTETVLWLTRSRNTDSLEGGTAS